MKKIKYHLFYKNNFYVLLNLSDMMYTKYLCFYDVYIYIKKNKIPFDSICMPRMTLDKLFRDYLIVSYNDLVKFVLNDDIPDIVKIAFLFKYYKGCRI